MSPQLKRASTLPALRRSPSSGAASLKRPSPPSSADALAVQQVENKEDEREKEEKAR
jgi:hypothetical protein